ncbi:hypothetical protein [Microvirga soli]|uniref:hypothetical protein n=1 Tax=Microvirga soli TaxID=1854496 RepID=UPI00191FA085|nr:hypothetical protein [Microvirga soli]
MTRKGTGKPVGAAHANGRLANGRDYKEAAARLMSLINPGENTNPIISHIVTASIAYADALTAKFGGEVNQKDHGALLKHLRAALGNRLPQKQLKNLQSILGVKDEVQYGVRIGRSEEAVKLLAQLEEFATWAEDEFSR